MMGTLTIFPKKGLLKYIDPKTFQIKDCYLNSYFTPKKLLYLLGQIYIDLAEENVKEMYLSIGKIYSAISTIFGSSSQDMNSISQNLYNNNGNEEELKNLEYNNPFFKLLLQIYYNKKIETNFIKNTNISSNNFNEFNNIFEEFVNTNNSDFNIDDLFE